MSNATKPKVQMNERTSVKTHHHPLHHIRLIEPNQEEQQPASQLLPTGALHTIPRNESCTEDFTWRTLPQLLFFQLELEVRVHVR